MKVFNKKFIFFLIVLVPLTCFRNKLKTGNNPLLFSLQDLLPPAVSPAVPSEVPPSPPPYTPATGVLDTTFNGTGYIIQDNDAGGGSNGDDGGNALIVDPNGKIVVTGFSYENGTAGNRCLTWRFNSDGTPDTGFTGGGIGYQILTTVDHASGNGVVLDSGGNIYVTGSCLSPPKDLFVVKYQGDGTLDTSFNSPNGYETFDSIDGAVAGDDKGLDMTIRGGELYIAGTTVNVLLRVEMCILQIDTNGTLGPKNTFNFGMSGDGLYHFGITSDAAGRFIVSGGYFNTLSVRKMYLWRYTAGLVLDTSSFHNPDGYVSEVNNDSWGTDVAVDANGKYVVVGHSFNGINLDMTIWRYNPTDGSLDTSFGGSGVVTHDGAAGGTYDDSGRGVVIAPDGKIIVTGVSNNGTDSDMVIWRYNSDGSLDTSFNGTGYVVYDSAPGNDSGNAVALDSTGRIIVTGFTDNGSNLDMAVWRYK